MNSMRLRLPIISVVYTIVVLSLISRTVSFNIAHGARHLSKAINLLKSSDAISSHASKSRLHARNNKKNDKDENDEEEAKWDEDLEGKSSEMIIRSEDDMIDTDEWSSKTTQVTG